MSAAVLPLVIRADASSAMGTGHVMRCIALGQAWSSRGGRVLFVSHNLPPFLKTRLHDEKFELAEFPEAPASIDDAQTTARIASLNRAACIVVDGYHFDQKFRQHLKTLGQRIVAIDDFGEMTDSDVLVNSNAYATLSDYSTVVTQVEHSPLILAGHHFAMLRREFHERSQKPMSPAADSLRILLSCGGSDPKNATEKILRHLEESRLAGLHVTAVIGGSFLRTTELTQLIQTLSFPVSVVQNCQDMPGLMQQADLSITAGGSTCWELACLGIPMITIITADNQIRVAEAVEAFGIGWNVGLIESLSTGSLKSIFDEISGTPDCLAKMSRIGQDLIDGHGASRIADALLSPDVTLRHASINDSRMLWEWRNEEAVRLASFNTDPVPWEDHCRWFESRLKNPNSKILIAMNGPQTPIGQVRLDLANQRATISISIAEQYRSAGYGRTIIRKATAVAVCYFGVTAVDAMIRPENAASRKAFQKAGYRLEFGLSESNGAAHSANGLHFVFESPKKIKPAF